MTDVDRIEALARAGVLVSIVCAPCPFCHAPAARWSVFARKADGSDECSRAFIVDSFAQAVDVAEVEAVGHGWTPPR